jgi:hypothetical protein
MKDFYEGISTFESKFHNLTVFNFEDKVISKNDISRIKKLVLLKKANCIFITNQKEFIGLQDLDFVLVLTPEHKHLYLDDSVKELARRSELRNRYKELSQQKRTFPFYLLGSILILEPLIKVLYLKVDTGFDFSTVFSVVTSIDDPTKFIEFWGLFPIAGVALLRPAITSLFIFLSVQLYSIYSYLTYEQFTWPFVQENPHISSSLLLALNISLLVYFLVPENRKPYLFKANQLFRKNRRVSCKMEAKANFIDQSAKVLVLNISQTGLMMYSPVPIDFGTKVTIELEGILIRAKVVRELFSDQIERTTYGVEFLAHYSEIGDLIEKSEKTELFSLVG